MSTIKILNVNVFILKLLTGYSTLDKYSVMCLNSVFCFPIICTQQMTAGNRKCNTRAALQLRDTSPRRLEVLSCLALVMSSLMHSGFFQPPAIYWEELYSSFIQWWDLPLLVFIVYTGTSGHCESLKVSFFFFTSKEMWATSSSADHIWKEFNNLVKWLLDNKLHHVVKD